MYAIRSYYGAQLETARHFLDLEVAGAVLRREFLKRGANYGFVRPVLKRADDILDGHGLIGGESYNFV